MAEIKKQLVAVSCTIPLDSGFTHILFNLASQGYSHIYVEYYGSGDSGSIEQITLLKVGDVIETENNEDFPEVKKDSIFYNIDDELWDVIVGKVYKHILDNASDWYNNDGGGGKLFISTADYKFICDHYYNTMEETHEDINGVFGDN